MKATIFLRGFSVLVLMIVSFGVMAQGRGRSSGRERGHTNGYQRDYHHDNHRQHDTHVHRDVYVHDHHHHVPTYRRVVHHHHHYRPVRYVYYRDYNVYYDCDRSVYISYSGRSWTVSTGIPVTMHHIDMGRATRVDVDEYYDDDFAGYLDRSRPNGRLYAEW